MSALLGYGEFEQAVLLTELLFKSTNAGNAGQEKCSQSADESKKLGSVVQNLKEIKAQKEFYVNIHTLLLILATLPFTTASAERPFSCLKHLKIYLLNRGGARHFHLGGPLEGPVLQQGELSMVCVGLKCSDMTSRGKFWGVTGGARQNFRGAVPPPGTPLAPPLLLNIMGEERLSGLAQMQLHRSGVVSPKIWEGAKMVDFRRITLFCLEKRLSKHKMAIFSKNLGGMACLSPHWLRLCSTVLRCQIQKLC